MRKMLSPAMLTIILLLAATCGIQSQTTMAGTEQVTFIVT